MQSSFSFIFNSGPITNIFVDSKVDQWIIGDQYPIQVLLTQIGCAYAMYLFGTFACKTNIQIVSFALPMTLIMPVTITGLFVMCDIRNQDIRNLTLIQSLSENSLSYSSTIPHHLWFQCPVDNEYMTWFGDFGSWIVILWFSSSIWVTRHIWFPKSQRMASNDQLFGRPYYSGIWVYLSIRI